MTTVGRAREAGPAKPRALIEVASQVVGITVAEEATRYCSALRGLPQSAEGARLLTLSDEALRAETPHVWKLVLAWLTGGKPENPCTERPWHFGGRRAGAQRPNARVLVCEATPTPRLFGADDKPVPGKG